MRKFLIFMVVYALSMTAAWAQRSDVNGDGIVNSADVVCIYNEIIDGRPRELKDEVFTVNGVHFKMIAVKGGTFQMGATSEQGDDETEYEKPIHSVTLSSYSIGQTEVTQALWKAVMGSNPSSFKGDDLPVESMSWNDCQEFIKKLNALTGKNFRLPTEAEWEYACRGGNKSNGYKYSGSNNIDDVAWYDDNSNSKTHTVATKQPNELGIYDMSGNVCEWCQDRYGRYDNSRQTNPIGPESGLLRVYRGGGWLDDASYCRSSKRYLYVPGIINGYPAIGLRLVLPVSDMDLNGDDEVNSGDIVCIYNRITGRIYYDYGDEIISVNGVTFTMIGVEGGTFLMGCTSEQEPTSEDVDNFPIHNVTLSDYHIGQTEVTQALWKAVMANNPSRYKGDDLPVECVSWNDCQEFITKLNALTGKHFRRPTEAEWEYACRGGNKSKGYKYSGSNNIDDVAWYDDNSNSKPHTVATKQPNELGIYDMSGNVWEWCQDGYGKYSSSSQINPTGPNCWEYHVERGGGWSSDARYCRSSNRGITSPDYSDYRLGLRLVLPY